MREKIGGAEFKKMVINASAAIEQVKQDINELNVFPVPDGDTGTNMNLTIGAAVAQLEKSTPGTVGKAAEITASALLRGARGNSGVILSLLFRGASKSLRDKDQADAMEFSKALAEGVEAAYKAVMKPAEGTILTVSRLASAAAVDCAADETDVEIVLEHAIAVGYEALAETVNQNPVLKKAGVIDAGGKGYLIILEGMLKALRGEMIEASESTASPTKERAEFSRFKAEDINYAYCTEFIVTRENDKMPELLRAFLGGLGDSVVAVDDDEIIKVHVHTNEPGSVISEALTYGALLTVKIENMREQHTETVAREESGKIAAPEKKYGAVVVSAGDGLTEVFRDLGADGIITGGQTMNPSTEDILRAINKTPAEIVYVLPNNKNIIMAAEQCAPLSEKEVVIIPSRTIPQGISALLAIDAEDDESENTARMTAAVRGVRTAQITHASRDSEFDGTPIKSGEYLALLEDKLVGADPAIEALIEKTAEAFEDFTPEYITIFYGEDVAAAAAEECAGIISQKFPEAEITTVNGGQPVYYYMISVE